MKIKIDWEIFWSCYFAIVSIEIIKAIMATLRYFTS